MTGLLFLRALVASLEAVAAVATKADPVEVTRFLKRHNDFAEKVEARWERMKFWEKDDEDGQ
jgi:hypothetical protein